MRTKSLADVQPPDSIDKIANELKNEVNKNLEDGQIHRYILPNISLSKGDKCDDRERNRNVSG
nr:flagellar basal body-associated FliL family protein [Desulforamulus aquiferis]